MVEERLLIPKTKIGDYGKVKTDIYLQNFEKDYDPQIAIVRHMKCFSSKEKGKLKTYISIISYLDSVEEEFYLQPKINCEDQDWEIRFCFERSAKGYIFEGNVGTYHSEPRSPITAEVYNEAREKLRDICNPNTEYDMSGIVDLIRQIPGEYNLAMIETWDRIVAQEQNKAMSKKIGTKK